MKIIFFGTPEYVVPILESLDKSFKSKQTNSVILAVVTQKPKPTGRKQLLEYSAVDNWAHKKKVPIYFEPKDIIKNKISADIGVLASFGQILDKSVIDYFPYGIINLHPSLLPKFRGASPVQGAIVSGEKITGLTFSKMDVSLDKGQLISQFKEEILDSDTTKSLRDRLFIRASEVIPTLIPAYLAGKINLKPLSHFPNTFTNEIKKENAFIPPKFLQNAMDGKNTGDNWEIGFINNFSIKPTPITIDNFIRSMVPWPMAWTIIRIRNEEFRIKILNAHLSQPITHNSQLILDEVQLEGKNPVSWKQFKDGYSEWKLEV